MTQLRSPSGRARNRSRIEKLAQAAGWPEGEGEGKARSSSGKDCGFDLGIDLHIQRTLHVLGPFRCGAGKVSLDEGAHADDHGPRFCDSEEL